MPKYRFSEPAPLLRFSFFDRALKLFSLNESLESRTLAHVAHSLQNQ
jgi:hypothetical protein